MSYWTVCKFECERYKRDCDNNEIDCSEYTDDVRYCFRLPKTDYYEIPWTNGPYDSIQYLYMVSMPYYFIVTCIWGYECYRIRNRGLSYTIQVLSTMPIFKLLSAINQYLIWYTCSTNERLCFMYYDVILIFCKLLYESLLMLCFYWIAVGYHIVRQRISYNEIRFAVIIVSLFYVLNSAILIVEQYIVKSGVTYAISAIIYFITLFILLFKTLADIKILRQQLIMMARDNSMGYNTPVYTKYKIYHFFLFILLLNLLYRSLILPLLNAFVDQYYVIYYFIEIMDVVIVTGLLVLFRPRPNDPYFDIIPEMSADERVSIPPVYVSQTYKLNEIKEVYVENMALFTLPNDDDYIIGVEPSLNNRTGELIAVRDSPHHDLEAEVEAIGGDNEEEQINELGGEIEMATIEEEPHDSPNEQAVAPE